MNCICGHEATCYIVPNPLTGEPMEKWTCEDGCCRRAYVLTTNGPRWMLEGIWCADRECDTPTFRVIEYPRRGEIGGHWLPLWPTAEAVVATYRIEHARINGGEGPSQTTQYYCSFDCAPDLGATPHHGIEEGGDPHRDVIGPCIELARAKDLPRHAACFTEARGQFYRDWFRDHLHFPEAEIERLMALWQRDREA